MTSGVPLRVLVVDDEPAIRRFLRASLTAEGYVVTEAENGEGALKLLRRNSFDVVLLDLGLPQMTGFEVIAQAREASLNVPIVVLSSRNDEGGKVRALDLGADDYVTKPFGLDELMARLRAAVRHRVQEGGEEPIFQSGDLGVDLVSRVVTVRGEEVKLTPREYGLLRLLVAHAGKVLTHRYILEQAWDAAADVAYLRIYVARLRQKIESDPQRPSLILTEQGVGYRLKC